MVEHYTKPSHLLSRGFFLQPFPFQFFKGLWPAYFAISMRSGLFAFLDDLLALTANDLDMLGFFTHSTPTPFHKHT